MLKGGFFVFRVTLSLKTTVRGGGVKLDAGHVYKSRRGERVLVTAIDPEGVWAVHYIVLSGPYKGVGARDGSRLTREAARSPTCG